jgi:hypothetical protein
VQTLKSAVAFKKISLQSAMYYLIVNSYGFRKIGAVRVLL